MRSCLYEGVVQHRRLDPVEHAFRYRLFLVYVDLEELDSLFGRRGVWSTQWPAIARFRRADHLGDPARPLADCVRDLVEQRTGQRPAGPVGLLTSFRYFGFGMNPVSFYYCFNASGEKVESIVAEVSNTPWNDQHCYVLSVADAASVAADAGSIRHVPSPRLADWDTAPIQFDGQLIRTESQPAARFEIPKEFHVSPFMPMEMTYHWRVTEPRERLSVTIENHSHNTKRFDATLSLQRQPITPWQLTRALLRYPLLTMQIFLGIYWQALRLWLKRVPYVPHPRHSVPVATESEPQLSSLKQPTT